MKFEKIIKNKSLISALKNEQYTDATEIQYKCIPEILKGSDIVARSHTGSGKTLAFLIPILESLEKTNNIQCLIVSPTRELAIQILSELRKLTSKMENISSILICGGSDIRRQIKDLKRQPKIVVGTPGRLIDHINRRTIKLSSLTTLVLDEADEMLNMGFKEDIEEILSVTPKQKQVLLFSATYPKHIREITKKYQTNALNIEVGIENDSIKSITQEYFYVNKREKKPLLQDFVSKNATKKILIFANTKRMVENLSKYLNDSNLYTIFLHGDLRQGERKKVMQKVKSGKANILVATDVAARGLDIDDIEYILNYDIPRTSEFFLHRIGRTARAGKSGFAVNFITSNDEFRTLKSHEKFSRSVIKKIELPSNFKKVTPKKPGKYTQKRRPRNRKNIN